MKAIVRKRQHRIFAEPDKAELVFKVRGQIVDVEDIERWMRRHDVPKNELYVGTPEARKERQEAITTSQLIQRSQPSCAMSDCI
jgi:hypothetical protein